MVSSAARHFTAAQATPTLNLPDLSQHDTLPKLLRYQGHHFADTVAMREKDFGIWQEYTWAEYLDRVRAIALGLKDLGIGQGDIIGLIGDNRPDWVFGEVAAHAIGAMSMGIYRDVLEAEMAYLIDYTGCQVVIAEDEEQVDKLFGLEDKIPSVRHIVYADPRGMRKYDDPRLLYLEDLIGRGQAAHAANPDQFDVLIDATQPEDTAILCTTSGTTSNPKLAMLSHKAMIHHVATYLSVDPKSEADEYVSVLPLPWIMEQIYVIGKSLVGRMTINFPEEPETQSQDMREIGPTFILMAPRQWESMAADVRARMMDASAWKRALYDFGTRLGIQAVEQGKRSWLSEWILMRALRDRVGFSRLRSAATGGAALGPETLKFFLAMGVPLRQLYGQTELLGAYTLHEPDNIDYETVGVPFPGVKVKIENPDPEGLGEIVTWHPNMMSGYYKRPEDTAETFRDGWMVTGDAGYQRGDGQLVVIDRVKDLAETAQGIRFSPQYIENKLKFCPYIAEAVILGAGRDYLAAMICIRYSIVSKWAEKNRITFTTYTDLSARPEVRDLVAKEVEAINAVLPPAQRIRRFVLLYKELDPDDGELTRTRKVRRGVINEKYADIIDAIYGDADQIPIDTTITFQDGSSQRIQTTLELVDMEPLPHRAAGSAPAQAAE